MLDIFRLNVCQDLEPSGSFGGDGLHWQLLPPHMRRPGLIASGNIFAAAIRSFLLCTSEAGFGAPLCLGGHWQRHPCPCSQVDSLSEKLLGADRGLRPKNEGMLVRS